jgi:hypothetical protein
MIKMFEGITGIIAMLIITVVPLIILLAVMGVLLIAIIIVKIFWVKMIIDAAKRQFPKPNDKLMWILIIVFTSGLGAIIYYFAVKRRWAGKGFDTCKVNYSPV